MSSSSSSHTDHLLSSCTILVDRVTQKKMGFIEGYKNVSVSESCFAGHFPELPVFPGVLILEAWSQLLKVYYEDGFTPVSRFERVRFKRPVVPGDRLVIRGQMDQQEEQAVWKMLAEVDGHLAARGRIIVPLSRDK